MVSYQCIDEHIEYKLLLGLPTNSSTTQPNYLVTTLFLFNPLAVPAPHLLSPFLT